MGVAKTLCARSLIATRHYCQTPCQNTYKCKLLVVGGGAGGCSVTWRFSKILKNNEIIVIEPSKVHYCQPSFALIAAGLKTVAECRKPIQKVLPSNVIWFCDAAQEFDPHNNVVYTACGHKISYDYMVVAVGLENNYDVIPGLKSALDDPRSCVTTIYSPDYCRKTWCCIKNYRGGHAMFTFPFRGAKCSGAAQKIMYLADDYWRKHRLRHITNITYMTGGEAMFGVPKYATALTEIARSRQIVVNKQLELAEVVPPYALFVDCKTGTEIRLPFNILHVTPHMSPPACLSRCTELVTDYGYLHVDQYTLQSVNFPNVYGLGDCTCTPNSKTAAAVAKQSSVVEVNLKQTMAGKPVTAKYDGYGACHMLTSYKKGILAEFKYNKKTVETFPFDQSKERRMFAYIYKYILPYMYWNRLIKGKWNGPSAIRKLINPVGKSK